jgi:hypothetical protein
MASAVMTTVPVWGHARGPNAPRQEELTAMTPTKDRTARWHRYWDKKSRSYDKEMRFFDRQGA